MTVLFLPESSSQESLFTTALDSTIELKTFFYIKWNFFNNRINNFINNMRIYIAITCVIINIISRL